VAVITIFDVVVIVVVEDAFVHCIFVIVVEVIGRYFQRSVVLNFEKIENQCSSTVERDILLFYRNLCFK